MRQKQVHSVRFLLFYCLNSKAINILIIHENEAKKIENRKKTSQCHKKCRENSMENRHTDVGM